MIVLRFMVWCSVACGLASCGGDGTPLALVAQVAPTISSQPVDQRVTAPESATFSAVAAGVPAPTYQWQVSNDAGSTFTNIAGATAGTYTTPPTASSDSGKRFRVQASNSAGTVASATATLTVNASASVSLAAHLAGGVNHACAIRTDGTVACWGQGAYGELGNGSTSNQTSPVTALGLSGVAALSNGEASNEQCAVRSDGTVACWGFQVVVNGGGVNVSTPTTVAGLSGVVAMATGNGHVCAVRSDGTVACWGINMFGELGDGTRIDHSAPANVTGLTNAVAIVAGYTFTCALKADTSVACWGQNSAGNLGNGTMDDSYLPTAVTNLSGVVALAAGDFHICAVKADASVVCWGSNVYGQLGDSMTAAARVVPSTVAGIGSAAGVAAGADHTCVVRTDRSAVCFGLNQEGQIGDGTSNNQRMTPTVVSGLSNVGVLAAQYANTCAVLRDGSVKCWGRNEGGEVGDGTTTPRLVPTLVPGLTAIQ